MARTDKPFSAEWLRNLFHESGKKQRDLVVFLQGRGIASDATKVSRSVKGEREIQADEMSHVWEFFGLPPEGLLDAMKGGLSSAEASPAVKSPFPNAGLPERAPFDRETMPILGVSVGGEGRTRSLFNGETFGSVARPSSLAGNRKAYATYVHGNSMEPRYEAGELVLVNPDKPYRQGNYVVAQIYDNEGDPPFGYVKKFVSFGKTLVLEQLNPPEGEDKLMRFPRDRVLSVHRIVGTLDE